MDPLTTEFRLAAACVKWPVTVQTHQAIHQAADRPIDWTQFLGVVQRHRIGGLVHRALKGAGVLLPADISHALADRASAIARNAMMLTHETAQLQRLFEGAGIPVAVVKGAILAKLIYGDITVRHARDIDLLVSPESVERASLLLEHMCDLAGHGRVVSIDVNNGAARERLPTHDRLTFLSGSSTDPAIVEQVHVLARAQGPDAEVMVILDSDHYAVHVMGELQAYAPLVRPGGYLIVEDGNVNGRPVLPNFGPGPGEAAIAFLKNNPDFEVDSDCERFLMTCNPGGYLRRKTPPL